jgi:hypothetical protein
MMMMMMMMMIIKRILKIGCEDVDWIDVRTATVP